MSPPDSTPPGSGSGGGSGSSGLGFVPPTPEELDALLPSFEVNEQIGMGGMGAVYRGEQTRLERPVAIKVMPAHIGEEYNFAERFEREAKAMAQLSHNNIVGVIDFGELQAEDGSTLLCFIMEFVEGSDLQQIIRAGLPPDQAMPILAQICDAMAYAHANGIIHRDIKPANILIDKTGKVKVADFGLAKVQGGPGASSAVSQVALGTPDYAAPEVFVVGSDSDHRADIYSLGVLIYEALTGQIPRGIFESPSKLNPKIDPRFDEVILKAMAQDQGKRFQHVSEISSVLGEIKKGPKPIGKTGRVLAVPKLNTARQFVANPTTAPKGSTSRQLVAAPAGAAGVPVAQPVGTPADMRQTGSVSAMPAQSGGGSGSSAWMWMVAGGIGAVVLVLSIMFLGGDKDGGEGGDPPKPPGGGEVVGDPGGTKGGGGTPVKPPPDPGPPGPPKDPDTDPGNNGGGETPPTVPVSNPPNFGGISKEAPFENSLGMRFVPVPITGGPTDTAKSGKAMLFSIWETRRRDYRAFVEETKRQWPNGNWEMEDFVEGDDHPAVMVNWNDAKAFCEWLTERERKAERIPGGAVYRLPIDHEWSCAVGIGEMEDPAASPNGKNRTIKGIFPWGSRWPPGKGDGNYYGEETQVALFDGRKPIEGFDDAFPRTAPVGSFDPNELGLYDLGGNVWEWCEEHSPPDRRTLRGDCWFRKTETEANSALSSGRAAHLPNDRNVVDGFRCVLEMPVDVDPPSEEGWVNALAAIDLERDTVMGEWKRNDDGSIENGSGSSDESLGLPFPRVAAYELEVEIERISGGDSPILFVLSADEATSVLGIGRKGNPELGDGLDLDGEQPKRGSEGAVTASALKQGDRFLIDVRVEPDGADGVKVRSRLDGEVIFEWAGAHGRFRGREATKERDEWAGLSPQFVAGLAVVRSSQFRIHSLRYRDLTKPVDPPVAVSPEPPKPANPDDKVAVRLGELAGSFKATYESDVEKVHVAALATLNTQFGGALKRAEDAAAAAGKLDAVLMIQKEAEQIAAGKGVPDSDAPGTPESLVKLRNTYRAQVARLEAEREQRAKPIFDTYVKALRDYETELTKAREIEGALRVKAFREEVETRGARTAADAEAAVPPKEAGVSDGTVSPMAATKTRPFENSLGMKFVPVNITGGPTGGKKVLFSIWETRRGDYDDFVAEKKRDWPKASWAIAGFTETDAHPAVMVSMGDAVAFCEWLTEKERKAGRLDAKHAYRLPSDHEWSCAVGIGSKEDPRARSLGKSSNIPGVYPWGKEWPPPKGSGNFMGFDDGFSLTSPVGSFVASQWGLYDLGGNVWEICEGNGSPDQGIYRGVSWKHNNEVNLLSSHRIGKTRGERFFDVGFRCVLAEKVEPKPDVTTGGPEPLHLKIPERPEVAGGLEVYRRDGKEVESPTDLNTLSQLPDGLENNVVAVSVARGAGDKYVVACALLADGSVRLWSANVGTSMKIPKADPGLKNIVQIATAFNSFFFLDGDGVTYQIGSEHEVTTPKKLNAPRPAVSFVTLPNAKCRLLDDGTVDDGNRAIFLPGDVRYTVAVASPLAALGTDGNWRLEKEGKPGEFWTFESRGLRGMPIVDRGRLMWIDETGTPRGKTTEGKDFHVPTWNSVRNARQVVAGHQFYGIETDPGEWRFSDELFNSERTLEKNLRGCTSIAVSARYVFGIRPGG